MIKPPLNDLLELVDCRYTLVVFVAKRAREIVRTTEEGKTCIDKPVNFAINEISAGKIAYEEK